MCRNDFFTYQINPKKMCFLINLIVDVIMYKFNN